MRCICLRTVIKVLLLNDGVVAIRWRGWSRCGFFGGDVRAAASSLACAIVVLHVAAATAVFVSVERRALGDMDARERRWKKSEDT